MPISFRIAMALLLFPTGFLIYKWGLTSSDWRDTRLSTMFIHVSAMLLGAALCTWGVVIIID
jgi:hypothetical protein